MEQPEGGAEEKDNQKNGEKKFSRKKETQEEKLEKIDIKKSEQVRLDAVFSDFLAYEAEKSSDDESSEKKYKKAIEDGVNKKRKKIFPKSTFVSKTAQLSDKKKKKKTDEEDEEEEVDKEKEKKNKEKKKGFSFKAIRKTLRNLCNEYAKDDVTQMIWEVDEDGDGYVSEQEFINMYKKCIVDKNEEEGKKLFYLVQFLMYDLEKKHYIIEDDTLEILCARDEEGMDDAIDAIFGEDQKQPNGKIKRVKRDKLNYIEYEKRMHQLSMGKRKEIANRKKDFCKRVQAEVLKKE